jgi:hypothetical protein
MQTKEVERKIKDAETEITDELPLSGKCQHVKSFLEDIHARLFVFIVFPQILFISASSSFSSQLQLNSIEMFI